MTDEVPGRLVRDDARIVLRPIGSPMPFGFLGLAVATLVLTGLDLGWVPEGEQHQVALVLVAFAFPIQLVAAVFGFLGRDTVVGSGIGVLGGTWLTLGLLLLTSPPGTRSRVVALFLFVAAAALFPSILNALHAKVVPAAVLAAAGARFVLTGVAQWTGSDAVLHAAGWEGLALCLLAIYAAVALELEDIRGRTVLPLLRHGPGRAALEGRLPTELAGLHHEAGVRSQL